MTILEAIVFSVVYMYIYLSNVGILCMGSMKHVKGREGGRGVNVYLEKNDNKYLHSSCLLLTLKAQFIQTVVFVGAMHECKLLMLFLPWEHGSNG